MNKEWQQWGSAALTRYFSLNSVWKTHVPLLDLISVSELHIKLPSNENSYLHFRPDSPFDGGTAECAVCPQSQWIRVSPGEKKHPWCFHSHSGPGLLTFSVAFMWWSLWAHFETHNMLLNRSLKTDTGINYYVFKQWKEQRDDLQQ